MACRSLKDKKEPGHKSNVRVRTADALKNSFNGGQLKRESHTIGRSKVRIYLQRYNVGLSVIILMAYFL